MVLASKSVFGALRIDLDLNIRKNGSLNPEIRICRILMNQEGCKFLPAAQQHGLREGGILLLLFSSLLLGTFSFWPAFLNC